METPIILIGAWQLQDLDSSVKETDPFPQIRDGGFAIENAALFGFSKGLAFCNLSPVVIRRLLQSMQNMPFLWKLRPWFPDSRFVVIHSTSFAMQNPPILEKIRHLHWNL